MGKEAPHPFRMLRTEMRMKQVLFGQITDVTGFFCDSMHLCTLPMYCGPAWRCRDAVASIHVLGLSKVNARATFFFFVTQ
jgi:hypothetical protein